MLLDPQRAPSFSAYDAVDVQVVQRLSMAYRALGFRAERSVHLDPECFLQAHNGITLAWTPWL